MADFNTSNVYIPEEDKTRPRAYNSEVLESNFSTYGNSWNTPSSEYNISIQPSPSSSASSLPVQYNDSNSSYMWSPAAPNMSMSMSPTYQHDNFVASSSAYPHHTGIYPQLAYQSVQGSPSPVTTPHTISPHYGLAALPPLPPSPPSGGSVTQGMFATPTGHEDQPTSSSTVFAQMPASDYNNNRRLYTFKEQQHFFKEALTLPYSPNAGPFIPQTMYKPHTNSDRRRYVEEVDLDEPIYFWVENPDECGILLSDALHSRVRRLLNRDETVFEGRGPSVSIRLEWPGYRQWSRQIPTKDFRSPPGPITKAKLAKNVAKCVQRFISAQERQSNPPEEDTDRRWRVGPNHIKLEDLVLVSMHHVSMGSWQPQLRLRQSRTLR